MHEYPFNIVEHDYFVDFINSLRPSFTFKSRVTGRKDIMDIYETEKDKLYAYLKTVNVTLVQPWTFGHHDKTKGICVSRCTG